jgi:hypothetical protein
MWQNSVRFGPRFLHFQFFCSAPAVSAIKRQIDPTAKTIQKGTSDAKEDEDAEQAEPDGLGKDGGCDLGCTDHFTSRG